MIFDDKELRKALRSRASDLDVKSARFLVDSYYQMQELRIMSDNRVRAVEQGVDDNAAGFMDAMSGFYASAEKEVAFWLDKFSAASELGRWGRAQKGVGPVIAAGLLAHIDLDQAKAPSSVWRYAGLDPSSTWDKGQKRPWNAELKKLCWKLGESFIKVQQYDDAVYGHLYAARKRSEWQKNARGELVGNVEGRKGYAYGATTDSHKWMNAFYTGVTADMKPVALEGAGKMTMAERLAAGAVRMIPPQAVHGRARRYAVKMFLSHYWAVGYEIRMGKPAPNPWIIEHGGHVGLVPPPNWPLAA